MTAADGKPDDERPVVTGAESASATAGTAGAAGEATGDARGVGTSVAADGAPTRFGFVAIVGAPNAGKSTLLNQMVGQKVSIVSRKVQTTRMPIRGLLTEGGTQLVFVDTPGIFTPKRRLDRAMVHAAWGGAGEADIIVLVIDAQRSPSTELLEMIDKMALHAAPVVLVLNKIDQIEKTTLFSLTVALNRRAKFAATFMVSALRGSGVKDLAAYLLKSVPEGVWHFPEDEVTDLPARLIAAEVTRERIYDRLHDELPYAIAVETTAWNDMGRKKGVRIEQIIYVERDSQRMIVIGEGARTVKKISSEARTQMADIFGRPVHLFLHVSVRAGWENDPERYASIGLEFPKD